MWIWGKNETCISTNFFHHNKIDELHLLCFYWPYMCNVGQLPGFHRLPNFRNFPWTSNFDSPAKVAKYHGTDICSWFFPIATVVYKRIPVWNKFRSQGKQVTATKRLVSVRKEFCSRKTQVIYYQNHVSGTLNVILQKKQSHRSHLHFLWRMMWRSFHTTTVVAVQPPEKRPACSSPPSAWVHHVRFNVSTLPKPT